MEKGKRVFVITIVIVCLVSTAVASGLFPDMDEMFGTSMPSVGLTIGRNADEIKEDETGSQEKYLNFGDEDYIAFGQYLAGIGAKVVDYIVANNTLTATISARNASMEFSYNWTEQIGIATYPTGTRVETEKKAVDPGENILPPIGGVMPSPQFAINREPDELTTKEEGMVLSWKFFTDKDYEAFSAYLAETGAVLADSGIDAGVLNAVISLNGFSFRFIYNWNTQMASAIYPEGTTPESSRWNATVGKGSILPKVKELGKELPRLSMAIKREPSSTETLEDGSLKETYLDFSEADYNTFSMYLQETGCSLVDYHTDENGVMVINLTNGSGKMAFSYDALHHSGIAEYPAKTRVEKAWVPAVVATPEPAFTSTPTAIPVQTFSSDEYIQYAALFVGVIKGTRVNPSSLQVHSIRVMKYNEDMYMVIDFSSMNGFGGYVRETYSFKFEKNRISLSGNSSDYDAYDKHKNSFILVTRLDVDAVMKMVR